MTKCVVIRTFLEQEDDLPEGEEDETSEDQADDSDLASV
jgi:hypothetical protein